MRKLNKRIKLLCLFLMAVPILSYAQVANYTKERASAHQELPDDSYLQNTHDQRNAKAGYVNKGASFFTIQVNVNASGENILGDAANEPSLGIDPTNPDNMVIGWRQFDNIYSNFRQAGYAYTSDAGQSWTFPGVIEPGVFRSDPVLDSDSDGNIYYNSLTANSGIYSCQVFKSDNGGVIWDPGVDAKGGDKQWMVIDKGEGVGAGNIYSFWTSYYSMCPPGFSTRSTDNGNSFEFCEEVDGNPYWGTMAVGADGELYVVGAFPWDGLVVVKSTTAQNPAYPVYWDFSEQVEMDGYLDFQNPVNPAGLLGQSYIDVDRSEGAGRGNVYVLASMARNSISDPADVMFARSTDGGETWSAPTRINDDLGNYNIQWFGTMSVAPNGRIDAVWLDTRDALPGTYFSSLYYSFSDDQGESWSVNQRLSDEFDPHLGWPQQDKMGDYFDMESDETSAHLAWANTFNGEQDVYYGHIIPQYVAVEDHEKQNLISLTNYPNPFVDQTTIRYTIPSSCQVTLEIIDICGQVIHILISENQPAGFYSIDITGDKLTAGYYFCRLRAGTHSTTTRIVKIN